MNVTDDGLLQYRGEIEVELLSGKSVVRVEYRWDGERRLTRFLLVPDDGETFESVAAKIVPAILAHDGRTP